VTPFPSYREIPLTKGQVALVDAADYEWLMQWKWFAHWAPVAKKFYAVRNEALGLRKQHIVPMHRQILGLKRGDKMHGDHINMETLDNRRSNLRIASGSQNMMNRRLQSNNKSGTKGVYWDSERRKWASVIGIDGKYIRLGRFDHIHEAASAYAEAAKKYHGEFARLS
jgi:hypothetical protein